MKKRKKELKNEPTILELKKTKRQSMGRMFGSLLPSSMEPKRTFFKIELQSCWLNVITKRDKFCFIERGISQSHDEIKYVKKFNLLIC